MSGDCDPDGIHFESDSDGDPAMPTPQVMFRPLPVGVCSMQSSARAGMSVDLSAFRVSVLNGLSGMSFESSMSPCENCTFRHLRDRINDLYARSAGTNMVLLCRDRNHAVLRCGHTI